MKPKGMNPYTGECGPQSYSSRDVIGELESEIESLRSELAAKDRRIEELQHEVTALQGWLAKGDESAHIITREQIDKAWALANDPVAPPEARAFMRTILEKFDIVACEWKSDCGHFECSGGETATRMPPENYEAVPICPDCNGNGWVKT